MTSMATSDIPTTFEYNDSDVESKKQAYPQLKPRTTFKLAVTEAGRGVDKDFGNLQLFVQLAPVDATDTPQTISVRRYVSIPVPSGKAGHVLKATAYADGKSQVVEGEKAKDELFKKARDFVRAFSPETIPAYPFIKEEDSGKWFDAEGGEASKEGMDEARKAWRTAVMAKLKEWYTNPEELVNATCYGESGDMTSSQRVYVNKLFSEPGDRTVETDDFTVTPEAI